MTNDIDACLTIEHRVAYDQVGHQVGGHLQPLGRGMCGFYVETVGKQGFQIQYNLTIGFDEQGLFIGTLAIGWKAILNQMASVKINRPCKSNPNVRKY